MTHIYTNVPVNHHYTNRNNHYVYIYTCNIYIYIPGKHAEPSKVCMLWSKAHNDTVESLEGGCLVFGAELLYVLHKAFTGQILHREITSHGA